MIRRPVYWICIFVFFFEEFRVNSLSRENKSLEKAESSNASKSDKSTANTSSSFLSRLINSCGNIFKKDYQLATIGLQYQRDKRYDDAIYCFNKALEKKPKDPVPYYRLRGDCYREMGKEHEALNDYREVIKANNKADRVIFSRLLYENGKIRDAVFEMTATGDAAEIVSFGDELVQARLFAEAAECFNAAIHIDGNVAEYYRKEANCLSKLPHLNSRRKVNILKRAVELESSPIDRKLLIRAQCEAGDYKDAVDEAIILDDLEELARLGDLLTSRRQSREAIQAFDALIAKNPTRARYYGRRGVCYAQLKMYDKAIADFCEMARREPNMQLHSHDLNDLKNALWDYGKIDESVEGSLVLLSAYDLEDLGNKFIVNRRFDTAIRCFTEALNRRASGSAYRSRAKCYMKMKNFTEAFRDFSEMVRTQPHDRMNKTDLKNALRDYGIVDEVVEESIRLLSIQDLEDLGYRFSVDGKFDIALLYFDKILDRKVTSSAYISRATCHLDMGNSAGAISDLQAALTMSRSRGGGSDIAMKLLSRALLTADSNAFGEVSEDTLNLLNCTELQTLGTQFKNKDEHEAALRCYNAALRKDSIDPIGYKLRADLYSRMGDYDKAIEDCLQVARMDPDDRKNWTFVKGLLTETGRFDDLIEYTANLFDMPALLNLCDELHYDQKLEEALRCHNAAIVIMNRREKDSTNLQLYTRRGNFLKRRNNVEGAVGDFLHVARADPQNKENWNALTEVLLQCGKFMELIDYTLHLSDIDELATLGDRFATLGHADEALRCYTAAIIRNQNPGDPQYFKRRATGHLILNNVDEAIQDFVQVVNLNPDDRDSWNILSSVLHVQERFDQLIEYTLLLTGLDQLEKLCSTLRLSGKVDEAMRCYAHADKAAPSDPEFFKRRATFYLELGEKEMAVPDLLTVSKIQPADSENWTRLIQTLVETERTKELFVCVQNAIPKLDADQLAEVGDKFLSVMEFDRAIHFYTEAIKKNPYVSRFYKRRGNAYVKMKFLDMAEFDFVQVMELDPDDVECLASLDRILFESEKYDELINYTTSLHGPNGLADLGDKFMAADQLERALQCYNEGIMHYPKKAVYHHRRGIHRRKIEKSENGISDLKAAVALAPDNVPYRIDLIDALLEVRKFSEAKTALAAAHHVQLKDEDRALLEVCRQNIDIMRIKELTDYLAKLIKRDVIVQTDLIRWQNGSPLLIKDLELDGDRCLEALSRVELENRTHILQPPMRDETTAIDPPDYFSDHIMYAELVHDPVTTPNGATYERAVIQRIINESGRDPLSSKPLTESDLRPNLAIKEGVRLWEEDHPKSVNET